jgi:hypothetical protein
MHLSYSHGCLFVVVAFAIGLIFCVHVLQDIWADFQPVRLRLSAKSASQLAVFFSQKKPASSTFSQPDQPKRTDCSLVAAGQK